MIKPDTKYIPFLVSSVNVWYAIVQTIPTISPERLGIKIVAFDLKYPYIVMTIQFVTSETNGRGLNLQSDRFVRIFEAVCKKLNCINMKNMGPATAST